MSTDTQKQRPGGSAETKFAQTTGDPLFPLPSHINSPMVPNAWPGIHHDSSMELCRLLRMDYDKFHCFFNDDRFHNHLTHHLFALYSFGATPSLLRSAYQQHATYQRPAYEAPASISSSTWKEHLGDEDYYNGYLKFFSDALLNSSGGATPIIEKYVFSHDANTPDARMLDRFMSGLVHPIIHTAHGTEFQLIGMVAEGLAMTAVHTPQAEALLPPDFFVTPSTSDDSMMVSAKVLGKLIPTSLQSSATTPSGVHSFSIVGKILKDDRLAAGKTCKRTSTTRFADTLKSSGELIRSYTATWTVNSPEEVEAKVEELAWLATLLYGLGGFREGHEFRADFFLVHMVTSSIFIPSLIATLSFPSQSALLRAQFSTMIGYWISRGRPALPIASYYKTTAGVLAGSHLPTRTHIAPSKEALGSKPLDLEGLQKLGSSDDQADGTTPANPWLAIVQSALNHPDEHLIKAERSLSHFSRLYGTRPPGSFSDEDLEGAEILDGTLFTRVAIKSLDAMGWVREGQAPGSWDRAGLGWDEVWQ